MADSPTRQVWGDKSNADPCPVRQRDPDPHPNVFHPPVGSFNLHAALPARMCAFFPLFPNSNCDMSAAQGAPVGTFLDIFF